jgi:hypothetical protein
VYSLPVSYSALKWSEVCLGKRSKYMFFVFWIAQSPDIKFTQVFYLLTCCPSSAVTHWIYILMTERWNVHQQLTLCTLDWHWESLGRKEIYFIFIVETTGTFIKTFIVEVSHIRICFIF